MRIINQTGKYDFPYEQSIVVQENQLIYVKYGTEQRLFASYSTLEKAVAAIDELHDAYYRFMRGIAYHEPNLDFWAAYRFPYNDEIEVGDGT